MLPKLEPNKPPSFQRPKLIRDMRRELEREAFALRSGTRLREALAIGEADLDELIRAGRELPADPYDATGMRSRVYSQVVLCPWNGTLFWLPPFFDAQTGAPYTTYLQEASSNPEVGGIERRFAPVPYPLQENRAFCTLIRELWGAIPAWRAEGRGRAPVLVGSHISNLKSDGRRAAMPSPREIHVDGEPFTFVVLLERTPNLVGGVSYVARRHCATKCVEDVSPSDILAEGTLSGPLDTLVVDDAAVSHTVSGVRTVDGKPGWRIVLFIDYSVLKPARTCPPAAK